MAVARGTTSTDVIEVLMKFLYENPGHQWLTLALVLNPALQQTDRLKLLSLAKYSDAWYRELLKQANTKSLRGILGKAELDLITNLAIELDMPHLAVLLKKFPEWKWGELFEIRYVISVLSKMRLGKLSFTVGYPSALVFKYHDELIKDFEKEVIDHYRYVARYGGTPKLKEEARQKLVDMGRS